VEYTIQTMILRIHQLGNNMETIKQIVNHPLSKSIACGILGAIFLLEAHPLYAGVAFGMGLRELLLAFKS